MKKLIATLLSAVMIFGMSVTVFAHPGPIISETTVHFYGGIQGNNLCSHVRLGPNYLQGQRVTFTLIDNQWQLTSHVLCAQCTFVQQSNTVWQGSNIVLTVRVPGKGCNGCCEYVPEVWTRVGPPTVTLPTGLNVFRHHQHSRYGRQNNSVFGSIVISVVYSSNLPTSPDRTVTYTHNFDFWFGQGTSSARVNFPGHVFTYEDPNGDSAALVINPFSVNAVIQNQGQRQTVNICCRRYEIIPRSSVTVTQ